MLLELTRVFLFDLCCAMALLLTFRFSFQSPSTLKSLRIGLILVLVGGVIRLAADFGISVTGTQPYPAFDLALACASVAAAIGLLIIGASLFRLFRVVRAGKVSWRELNRTAAADTWII